MNGEKEFLIYDRNGEEMFLSYSIADLKRGRIVYVYKEAILNKLKKLFNDLEITKGEFYWTVTNKEKIATKKVRPRKLEVSK